MAVLRMFGKDPLNPYGTDAAQRTQVSGGAARTPQTALQSAGGLAAPLAASPAPSPSPMPGSLPSMPQRQMLGVSSKGGAAGGVTLAAPGGGTVTTPGGAGAGNVGGGLNPNGVAPGANGSAANDYRAQAEDLYKNLLGMNQDARGQIQEMGQANIAALQRRNGAMAALAGRGIGGGYLGGQRAALSQGLQAMNQGLLGNDQQRMQIMGNRLGDLTADARANEERQFQLDRDLAGANAGKTADNLQRDADIQLSNIKSSTGMDEATMQTQDPELYAAYRAYAASGSQADLAKIKARLQWRQQQYDARNAFEHDRWAETEGRGMSLEERKKYVADAVKKQGFGA